MNVIRFNVDRVLAECALVNAAPEHRTDFYGTTIGKSLYLVGDRGIYLMGNHVREKLPPGQSYDVIYAEECNPKTMAFDDWYDAKRTIFGGDDGSDPLPVEDVERVAKAAKAAGKKFLKIRLTDDIEMSY